MGDKSILVVDDEVQTTLALESYFRTKGYRVLKAFVGDQALQEIEQHQPAVVILDMQMPGVDGVAVLEKIQNQFPFIKTLVVTGHSEHFRADLDRLRPNAVRYKPVSLEELTEATEALLGE